MCARAARRLRARVAPDPFAARLCARPTTTRAAARALRACACAAACCWFSMASTLLYAAGAPAGRVKRTDELRALLIERLANDVYPR